MATRKTAAVFVGLLLVAIGLALSFVTEPAGSPGSQASGGIADVSEETRPYLIPALVFIVVGVLVLLIAAIGKL